MCASSGYGRGCEYGSRGAPLSCAHNEFVITPTNNVIPRRSEGFDIDLSSARWIPLNSKSPRHLDPAHRLQRTGPTEVPKPFHPSGRNHKKFPIWLLTKQKRLTNQFP